MEIKISDVIELQRNHVKIKNAQALEQKLNTLLRGGKNNLQVIADFDCTLTKQRVDKRELYSSFGMFSECASVPNDYKQEDKRLCEIYKPIEVDPDLSIPEKTKHMVIWYERANDILKGLKFPADELNLVAKYVVGNLRDGVHEMFQQLEVDKVPVLVFSAGLGDAVVSVLKNSDNFGPNVKVISNFLNIDEDGIICGLKGQIIHVFNKNETVIKDTEYYNMIKDRRNIVLLGDSLGDALMADGVDSAAIIKIGFLFHNQEGNLPLYMDTFDIVLLDDQTVDIPRAILNLIC